MPSRIRSFLAQLAENPLIRRILRNSAYLFSASGIAVLLGFFQNLLVTNLLGVALFGILGGVVKFTSVLNKLGSFRMNELVVRYVGDFTEAGDTQKASAVFKFAALVESASSLFSYSLIFFLAPLGARFLAKDLTGAEIFTLYGLIVLGNLVLESSTGLLQILDRFRRIASLQVAQSLLTLALILTIFLTQHTWPGEWTVGGETYRAVEETVYEVRPRTLNIGSCVRVEYHPEGAARIADRITGLEPDVCESAPPAAAGAMIGSVDFFPVKLLPVVGAYMAGKLVYGLGVAAFAVYEATRRWGRGWLRTPFGSLRGRYRELFRFAFSTNISATINLVNKDSEELWILLLRNPTEAGWYKLALALANLVLIPISPFPQATYPELAREVARKAWANVRYILQQGSRMAAAYTGAAALLLIAFGRPLIDLLYQAEFLPAYNALVIMLVGLFVANAFYWNRTALLALDRPDYPTKVNALAAALKVSLIFLLVPRYGYLASAALLSGYYVFSVVMNVRKTYLELMLKEG